MKNLKLYEEFITESGESTIEKCEVCGTRVDASSETGNLCTKCEDAGYWVDPAGGVHSPDEGDPASMYENDSTSFTLQDFKRFFSRNYNYIEHNLTDQKVQAYLNQKHVKGESIEKAADLFSDYLLANGLADVQENKTIRFKDFLNEADEKTRTKKEFDETVKDMFDEMKKEAPGEYSMAKCKAEVLKTYKDEKITIKG